MKYDLLPLPVATDYLRELLHEFPFADDHGRSLSVQIAAMVSRFGFLILPRTAQIPFFCWNANGPRAGKTLLVKVVEIPVAGHANIQSLPEEKEELKKILDSEVLAGSQSIIFDNIKTTIESSALEQFATSSVHGGRRMGGNKTFSIRKQTMVMFTMNQTKVSPDIMNRSLFVDLFVKEADPQSRKIERVIGDDYLSRPEMRHNILSSLWSMIHAWDAAGCPAGSSRLAGFEEWSAIIGGIVEFCGFGDPLRRPNTDDMGDPDTTDMHSLVELLASGCYKEGIPYETRTGLSFDDLIEICRDNHFFEERIRGKVNRDTKEYEVFSSTKSAMGRIFTGYAGRQFRFGGDIGTIVFERVGNRNHRKYRVV